MNQGRSLNISCQFHDLFYACKNQSISLQQRDLKFSSVDLVCFGYHFSYSGVGVLLNRRSNIVSVVASSTWCSLLGMTVFHRKLRVVPVYPISVSPKWVNFTTVSDNSKLMAIFAQNNITYVMFLSCLSLYSILPTLYSKGNHVLMVTSWLLSCAEPTSRTLNRQDVNLFTLFKYCPVRT